MSKMMIKWRENRLKELIKLNLKGKISNKEFIKESEKLRNEIYQLKQLK